MPSRTPSERLAPTGVDSPAQAIDRVAVITQADRPEAAEFIAALSGANVTVDLRVTESQDDVAIAIRSAIDAGARAIASVGGDGALNLAVGALVELDSSVPVVPVRAGTVNLMTQILGLETPGEAADAVLQRRVRTIDVGETNQGVFFMNASTGYDAAVIADASDHSDARFGRLRFLVEGLRRLRRESPRHVAVNVDGDDVHTGRAMSVIVMNVGQRVSDGFDVAPDARIDDGLLDVVIVRAASVSGMLRAVVRLALGRPVSQDDVVRAQGARVEIDWRGAVASQRDGDACPPLESLVAVARPGALAIHHAAGV